MAVSDIAELEAALGHRFRDPQLLRRALMHSSRVPERSPDDPPGDNEKLEFLGDAVLELIVREELVRAFPLWREGQLSQSRARLVNASSLCQASQRLGLGGHLFLGRGEEKTGGRSKPALLADAYEAVVAAIYLDAGLEAARDFVRRSLAESAIVAEAERRGRSDHKSLLQELLQARGMPAGKYHVLEEIGPDHEKMFCVEVRLAGGLTAVGTGKTKKEAERMAALAALRQLNTGED